MNVAYPIPTTDPPVKVYVQPNRVFQPLQLRNPNMPNPHPNDMKDPRLAKSLSGG